MCHAYIHIYIHATHIHIYIHATKLLQKHQTTLIDGENFKTILFQKGFASFKISGRHIFLQKNK